MTYARRHELLAYRAERARRHWNDDRMWWWFKLNLIWLAVYVPAVFIARAEGWL